PSVAPYALSPYATLFGSVLLAVVADQGLGDGGGAGLDAVVAQRGQSARVSLAGEDRVDDGQPGDAGQVADDVMQVQVHLVEGLLHVLDMPGGGAHQHVAAPQVAAQHADLIGGAERGVQQADRVQVLQPLAVGDIGLATGHGLHVAGVDQADLEAAGLEHLEQGDPVNAGRLHGDVADTAGLQPVDQSVQVLGEGSKGADGLLGAIWRDGDKQLGGADVDAGRIGTKDQWLGLGFLFGGSWHSDEVPAAEAARSMRKGNGSLLNGIVALRRTSPMSLRTRIRHHANNRAFFAAPVARRCSACLPAAGNSSFNPSTRGAQVSCRLAAVHQTASLANKAMEPTPVDVTDPATQE